MDYNKLLEKARKVYAECVTNAEKRKLESVFPELAESEDERIRKAIKHQIERLDDEGWSGLDGVKYADMLAWLDKQGEPQPYRGDADTIRKNLNIG